MANAQVRPNKDGIRIRETPGEGRPIGMVGLQQVLESLESPAETRRKAGIPNEWLHLRKDDGTTGYIAAQFLTVVSLPDDPAVRVRCITDGLRIREVAGSGTPNGTLALNETVESMESAGETTRKLGILNQWLRVRADDGTVGYVAAWFMGEADALATPRHDPVTPSDPSAAGLTAFRSSPAPSAPAMPAVVYVRPKEDGLRIREQPRDGHPIGQVDLSTVLKSLETPDATGAKIGRQGEWLNVRAQDGTSGYVAAWRIIQADPPQPIARPAGGNIIGINLDQFHPLGSPDPARFQGLGWVRFGYNVSMGRGSQDIDAALSLYRPLAERYARAGFKVMFCFTHQTYGEGREEFWPWPAMTDEKWRRLTDRFADMINRIANQFARQGLVHAWQIWNEQDAPIGASDSVPMSARSYAHLLGRSLQAIRAADSKPAVITGGHTGGPGPGSGYARATIAALAGSALPDGIAYHPYGRGPHSSTRYADFGDIREALNAYLSVMPNRPVWISEWGALDQEDDDSADVANHAAEFAETINREYAGRVAALMWDAWAMGIHNAYGVVNRSDPPLQPLYERFLALHG